MSSHLHWCIGSDALPLLWWQMVVRGVLIFLYTLLLVRFSGTRVFAKHTSFDIVVGVMLGSIMSRAVTGNARFFPALAAATALVALHWLLTWITVRYPRLGTVIKGSRVLLVKDGRIDSAALRRCRMTEHDLLAAVRCSGGIDDVAAVRAAFLERNGQISVIRDGAEHELQHLQRNEP